MCVISYKKKGIELSEATFKKMWDKNGDGMGYIGRVGDGVFNTQKGIMDYDTALKTIKPYLTKEAETVIHLRIKSRGSIIPALCHPFDFSNDKELRFLCHNGTVSFLNPQGIDVSDTSFLTEKILSHCDTPSVRNILTNLSSTGSGRFVTFIQSKKKESDYKIEVFQDAESSEVDGCWFSNTRHLVESKIMVYEKQTPHTQKDYYKIQPPIRQDAVVRTPLIGSIVDFYKKKFPECSREQIMEDYSIDLMKTTFLEDIVNIIQIGKDADPITNFFNNF